MVQLWSSYGPSVVQLRSICGPAVVPLWSSYGPVVVQLWSSYDPVVVQLWSSYGPVVVQCGPVMVSLLVSFFVVVSDQTLQDLACTSTSHFWFPLDQLNV